MLTDEQIKKEWDEITHRVPPVCLNHFAHAIYKLGREDMCKELISNSHHEVAEFSKTMYEEMKP